MFAVSAALAFSLILTIWECIRLARSRRAGLTVSIIPSIYFSVAAAICLVLWFLTFRNVGYSLY